jgi:hypothetical protein
MQKQLTPSQKLAAFTSEFDNIFNHVLGYILAFTSLVAFADVLGNGRITSSLPWLFWLWILAQGLCVEFQVFVLVKRLPSLWTRNRAMFAINLVFIALLCVMSVIIGSVFVEHDNTGGTIEAAMSLLGINHVLFVYARSSLAILLVALIAIDRALEQHEQEANTTSGHEQEAIQQLVERIEKLTITVTEITTRPQHEQLSIPERIVSSESEQSEQDTNTVERIRSALNSNPDVTDRELAAIVGVAPSTANKWRKRIEQSA